MKNDIKHIIFDIDQTLLKPNGEFQPGCIELMQKVYESGIPVTFLSGKNMTEIHNFVDKLCLDAGIDQNSFHINFASNVGASSNTKREGVSCRPIKESDIREIEKIVSSIEKSSVIVYKTMNNNFIESLLDSKHKLKKFITLSVVKTLDEIGKVDFPISTKRREYIDYLLKDEQVLSLEVVCARKRKQVALALSENFPHLIVCEGSAVQISSVGKNAYIEQFVLDDNTTWQDVCMLGDALNDRQAIINAGYGILCNPKKKRYDIAKEVMSLQEKGQKKFLTNNLGNCDVVNFVTNKYYKIDEMKKLSLKVLDELSPKKEKEVMPKRK